MKAPYNKRIFRHYKGNKYEYIGIAKDSETREEMVVYRSLEKERQIWIRPKADFFGTVTVDGKIVDRFQEIIEKSPLFQQQRPYRRW